LPLTDRDVPEGNTATSPFFQNLPPAVSPFPVSDQPVNPPEYQVPPPSGEELIAAATKKAEEEKAIVAAVKEAGKRGRKQGSKNKVKEQEPTYTQQTGSQTTIPAPSVADTDVVSLSTAGANEPELVAYDILPETFTLYVNCMPIGDNYVCAETYIAQANQEICEKTGALEWRIGEAVAYGKGAGMLSIRVAELVKEQNRNVVLDTSTSEGSACKAALMALTGNIVMGFR
jgi:hypothetical protein